MPEHIIKIRRKTRFGHGLTSALRRFALRRFIKERENEAF